MFTAQHLAARWKRSLATIKRWEKIAPGFPKPVRYSAHATLWPADAITSYEQTAEWQTLMMCGRPAVRIEVCE